MCAAYVYEYLARPAVASGSGAFSVEVWVCQLAIYRRQIAEMVVHLDEYQVIRRRWSRGDMFDTSLGEPFPGRQVGLDMPDSLTVH